VSAEGLVTHLIDFLPISIKPHSAVGITRWLGARYNAHTSNDISIFSYYFLIQPTGAVLDLSHTKGILQSGENVKS
jgi:hypothetical protein